MPDMNPDSTIYCIVCGEIAGLSERDLDHYLRVCSEECNRRYHEDMKEMWEKIVDESADAL